MIGQIPLKGNCTVIRGCFSTRCLQFSMILLQLRFVQRVSCYTVWARKASEISAASTNPLLGEYTGLNFEVSAQHVEDAIPVLVNQTDTKFTEFEANLKGMTVYMAVCLLLDYVFYRLDLEKCFVY